jgi:hypothetical protein
MAKKFFDRNIEPLKVRKARHAAEAPGAAREYEAKARATLERMAKLRAERLAREKAI